MDIRVKFIDSGAPFVVPGRMDFELDGAPDEINFLDEVMANINVLLRSRFDTREDIALSGDEMTWAPEGGEEGEKWDPEDEASRDITTG